MPRIVVFGPSGSGKSTLSAKLATLLDIPHIELDALHWEPPGFTSSPEFLPRVQRAVDKPSWIVDGNYKETRVISEPHITHAIWLNFPFYFILFRILKRTFWRWWRRELLWGKCRETVSSVFSLNGRDGLIFAVAQNFRRRIRENEERVKKLQSEGITVWVFSSSKQVNEFVRRAEEKNSELFHHR